MSMKITPDIAELMGTYVEGGQLTNIELNVVHSAMEPSLFISSIDDVAPMPTIEHINMPLEFGPELLVGNAAIGILDDNLCNHNNMKNFDHSSVIGDITPFPDMDGFDVQQIGNDTCAIKSQQIILHSFGVDIPETSLVHEATIKGYYIPGQGTTADMVGLLLEDHGVDVHTKHHATVYDLAAELAQGHKVIVGVDADELWHHATWNDLFIGEQANHALIVTGIDTSNPLDTKVILTDPGTGEVARSFSMSQFIDAWQDSSCFMVATDKAPQVSYGGIMTNPEMINFDYAAGHIPTVGNIPYDIFTKNILPQFDDYFSHQLNLMHSDVDFHHVFDNMDNAFDHFDNQFADADFASGMNDSDINDMFNLFF